MSSMELPVVFNNRYQLIKKIGEGGLAEVYQAQDMALGRMVAVKALRSQYTRDSAFLVNFHKEAQSVARLSDMFIVAVYDFGQDKSRPYIVFEWVPGSDLRKVLDDQKKLLINQVIEYGIQICSAVGTAHRAGLVHGDLKPGNILVTPNNQAKVTDFGLARALGASAMDDGEVVWGTPAYFAPEQAAGERVLPATDVYAIGIILYEMLTGTVPFRGKDDQDVARKQIYEAHIPVDKIDPKIPEPLARIVDAAMAKNVNERFLTADHLREALIAYKQGVLSMGVHHAPISSVVGSPLQHTSPPPSKQQFVSASQANSRSRKKGQGIDILLMVLGLLAVVAIVGLLILFTVVYAAYSQGSLTLTPTENIVIANQVNVPEIIGMNQTVAQTELEQLGLMMVVAGSENHPTWPADTITQQSIVPGEVVPIGSKINVLLSLGPTLVELPDVVGMPADDAEQLLDSLDLVPQKYEDWSVEPVGLVIEQAPAPGTILEDRTLITLIVSSGSRVPIGANFEQLIALTAYEIPRTQYRLGENIHLTFFWNLIRPLETDYTLSLTLITLQGGIVSEIKRPIQGWNIGEIMVDAQDLAIPVTAAPGEYQIRVTFYDSAGNRLPLADTGRGQEDAVGALILRSVEIIE